MIPPRARLALPTLLGIALTAPAAALAQRQDVPVRNAGDVPITVQVHAGDGSAVDPSISTTVQPGGTSSLPLTPGCYTMCGYWTAGFDARAARAAFAWRVYGSLPDDAAVCVEEGASPDPIEVTNATEDGRAPGVAGQCPGGAAASAGAPAGPMGSTEPPAAATGPVARGPNELDPASVERTLGAGGVAATASTAAAPTGSDPTAGAPAGAVPGGGTGGSAPSGGMGGGGGGGGGGIRTPFPGGLGLLLALFVVLAIGIGAVLLVRRGAGGPKRTRHGMKIDLGLAVTGPDGRTRNERFRRAPVTIGRGRDNDLVLDDPKISRRHAEIVVRGDALHLVDEHSTHGSLVDGDRVDSAPISSGTSIRLGDTRLRIQ